MFEARRIVEDETLGQGEYIADWFVYKKYFVWMKRSSLQRVKLCLEKMVENVCKASENSEASMHEIRENYAIHIFVVTYEWAQ